METRRLLMQNRLVVVVLMTISVCTSSSAAKEKLVESAALVGGGSPVLVQALSRPDLVVASSRVNPKHLQGAIGESLTENYLNRGDVYIALSPKVGRQGIDLLEVKVDAQGRIRDLIVGEVKTQGARLGMTQDGRQMTTPYVSKRLAALAKRYRTLLQDYSLGVIERRALPLPIDSKYVLSVPLPGGRTAVFWKESSTHPWKIDAQGAGDDVLLRQMAQFAKYLEAASENRITYRRRIFRLKQEGEFVRLTVKDAAGLDDGLSESQLKTIYSTRLSASSFTTYTAARQSLAAELRRTNPQMTAQEIDDLAGELTHKKLELGRALVPRSMLGTLAKGSGMSAGIGALLGAGIDAASQLYDGQEFDGARLGTGAALGFVSGGLGYAAGYGTTHTLLKTATGLALSRQMAAATGITTTTSANMIGSGAGGAIGAAVFSYGLYFTGYTDLRTANRTTVAGVAASAVGAGAAAATTSLVAAYGTAGTGTAIATLHGAAATSATMAAIGGGSAAVGSVLVTTGAGIVIVGVGAGVMYCYMIYDQKQEAQRVELYGQLLAKHYTEAVEP
jgi:hypothetical protein